MKVQDILFLAVLIGLIFGQKKRLLVLAGLFCFLLAMPLFYFKVFFTGQRLTWYAAGFIFLFIVLVFVEKLKS